LENRGVKIGFLVFAALSFLGLGAWKVGERVLRADQEQAAVVNPARASGPAAPFDLEDWNGRRGTLADYRGRWVLLNFWATWCTSCAEELPSMSMMNRAFAKKGLDVVAISVDEEWAPVKAFFPHGAPSFRILLDPKGKVATAYGTVKFPETYLMDPRGALRAKFIGPRDWMDPRIVRYFDGLLETK
jgi:peroxiredoxin